MQGFQPTRATYDPNQTPKRQHPARKHFEAHELRRIPVVLTDAATAELSSASAESRKLQQALSEMFGGVPNVKEVHVDAMPRSTYFQVTAEDVHPVTGEELNILDITIVQEDDSIDPHVFHLNAASMLPSSAKPGTHGFNAAKTVKELVRLYPHKPRPDIVVPYRKGAPVSKEEVQ